MYQNTNMDSGTDVHLKSCGFAATSWSAVFAGSVTAAAASVSLVFLGAGIGLATMSPWSGGSIASFTAKMAIWLIIMQWISSALGGYITGRLRKRSMNVHADEVFFRDTAHGLLTWCLATLLVAGLFASVTTKVATGGTKAVTAIAAGTAAGAANAVSDDKDGLSNPLNYYVDGLYRSAKPSPANTVESSAESARIFSVALANNDLSADDKAYLTKVVQARTGITEQEASTRVDSAYANAKADKAKVKEKAEEARKASSAFAIFTFLSMMIGAFIACVSAALGGRLRDQY